jgi:hypothetical protein
VLQYPAAISERVGLELSQRLEDKDFAARLRKEINAADIQSL